LLKCSFISTARYVDWLASIVLVVKKNGTLAPKDEYSMPVAKMLVDSTAGHEYLSLLDGYYGYNQIYTAEEDVSKNAFRFTGALGCYEWIIMPFGLKNAGACY
jgi:hypothetical protein